MCFTQLVYLSLGWRIATTSCTIQRENVLLNVICSTMACREKVPRRIRRRDRADDDQPPPPTTMMRRMQFLSCELTGNNDQTTSRPPRSLKTSPLPTRPFHTITRSYHCFLLHFSLSMSSSTTTMTTTTTTTTTTKTKSKYQSRFSRALLQPTF